MKILHTKAALKEALSKTSGSVVLIPTMGALHRGHEVLLQEGRSRAGENGTLVVTIFVNPTQFGPNEDYSRYPQTPDEDIACCSRNGVDIVFHPNVEEMYADDASVTVQDNSVSNFLCGLSRPNHFSGVCTVVLKLFLLTNADMAIFGKKDYQQLAVIRRMVRDLDVPIEIIGVATVREKNGLAISSRNRYLSEAERENASVLRRSLLECRRLVEEEGERHTRPLIRTIWRMIREETPQARIDYVEVVDAETLQPLGVLKKDAVVALAVFLGGARLIDNILLSVSPPRV